jgi:hypothetical protein
VGRGVCVCVRERERESREAACRGAFGIGIIRIVQIVLRENSALIGRIMYYLLTA